jgi:histidinol-phosphate/aromatic aminotransferase/cobyric acid decarboxylase-like protein
MSLRLHGDTVAEPGMLDFAVNTWPGAWPPELERALAEALQSRGYPRDAEARAAVAARHGRDTREVLLANGACELFWLLAHVLRPRVSACIHPSFTEPEAALRAVGTEVVHVQRDGQSWRFDPAAVPDEATFVVVGNPNNPTGGLDSREEILAVLRPGRLVLVDESFMDFVQGEPESLAGETCDGLAVVRSLTKLWSLAAIRAGYLLGSAALVERLAGSRQPWSVNALACAALRTCVGDEETPRQVAATVADLREELATALTALPGVRVWPAAANFLLLRVPDGPAAIEQLREQGIAVRPGFSFPGLDERYLRVAVRPAADNARLVAALSEAVQ